MVKFEILSRLLLSVQAFAFRGRLMSLLAPARGMPTLSAKDGFSRPSLKPVPASSRNASKHASSAQGSKEAYPSSTLSAGSHRGLWDCDYSSHRKHFLLLESRVFQLLSRVFILNELLY